MAGDAGQARPNIIFLMADDQATYSMGCYGTPGAKTPNLDKLAGDGMLFHAHYDTTAICMASRASVMTGMFEYKTGCNFDHGPLLREHWRKSYPVLLREAGYKVAFAGKIGFEVTDTPGKRGTLPEEDFDRWGGGPGQTHYETRKNKSMAAYADKYPHATLAYGAFGADFIRDMSKEAAPFCLSISFKAPHRPVSPDPRFDYVYAHAQFTKPANYGREKGAHFSSQSRMGRQYERFESWDYDKNYNGVMAKYYQQIYAIDQAVGMIRDALHKYGEDRNTVIIYTSDNGFMNGSHGYGSKVIPYEESSRVPLIIYDPRHPNSGKALECHSLTGNVDFHPTILKLAGVPLPPRVDGRSLLPLYADPRAETHPYLPLINVWGPEEVFSFGVVSQDWKYIFWPYDAGDFVKTEEMYHLATDRLEMHDLSKDPEYANQLKTMRKAYDRALEHWRDEAVPYHNYQPFAEVFSR